MKKSDVKKGLTFAISALLFCLFVILSGVALTSCKTVFTSSHTHEWGEWTVSKDATCASQGQRERVCECGQTDTESLDTVEHTSDEWVIDEQATFRDCGQKHQVCSVCGTAFNETEIPIITVTILPGITDMDQDQKRPNYALGNCRKLEGNPVVVLLFVDDRESTWTAEEVEAFTQEHVLVGLEFLEKQAKLWGVHLDFTVESYSTPFSGYELAYDGVVNTNLFVGGSTKDVLGQAATDIGCASDWELYSYYKSKHPDDDIIFLNLLNKAGISYARHAISTGYSAYSEHCVIFTDYLDGTGGSRASTVAHEILHLFGAEDFYTPSSREALALQQYPDDIMLLRFNEMDDHDLGDCTAFSVGWTNRVPSVCYNAKWWQ